MDRPIWVCFNFALMIDQAQARHMGMGGTKKHTYPIGICHQNISRATQPIPGMLGASSPNTPVNRIYFSRGWQYPGLKGWANVAIARIEVFS